MSNLNVRGLLTGAPIRARFVRRYSTCRVQHQETVAEHSFYVQLYAFLIAADLEQRGLDKIDWKKLAFATSVHDLEETITGDWPRKFKHSDQALSDRLDYVAKIAMTNVAKEIFIDQRAVEDLVDRWEKAKDGSIEGRIVSFADFLSVMSYVIQEIESGNVAAFEHAGQIVEYFQLFDFNYGYENLQLYISDCRPLIEQMKGYTKERINGRNSWE